MGILDGITRSLNNRNILIGDANNLASQVLMTGDASLANDGTLTLASTGITPGTYRSINVDIKGRVTAGSNPTTLAGYGITDAMNISHVAYGITNTNITNWNTAYSWGNHSGLYRPVSYVPAWSEITSNPFSFTSPVNNQLIRYNSSTSRWENWTPTIKLSGSCSFTEIQ